MAEGNVEVMTASIEDGGKKSPRYTKEQVDKAFKAHGENIKKMEDAANTPDLRRADEVPYIKDEKIIAAIRKLGEAGYVTEDDFGWYVDELVTKALRGVKAPAPLCKV